MRESGARQKVPTCNKRGCAGGHENEKRGLAGGHQNVGSGARGAAISIRSSHRGGTQGTCAHVRRFEAGIEARHKGRVRTHHTVFNPGSFSERPQCRTTACDTAAGTLGPCAKAGHWGLALKL